MKRLMKKVLLLFIILLNINLVRSQTCTANINLISPILCSGTFVATIQVITSGGIGWYNYSLSYEALGNWYSLAQQWSYDTAYFNNLPANHYRITVTDTLGCSTQDTVTITEPPFLTLVTTQTNVSCNGSSDGVATVIPSGGTLPYTYNWNNGATQKQPL